MDGSQLIVRLKPIPSAQLPAPLQDGDQYVVPRLRGGLYPSKLLRREGQQMLLREPGPPGLQIRGPAQLQIADHARQDEVHLLQPAPLLLQRLPLDPEEVQSLPGILPSQTAADLRQRGACLPEDGDSVKIIELFRVVIKIPVLPPVGREQEAKVLIVPQSLLGSAAQGGEGAGGHPSPMFHKIFSPKR